MELVVKNTQIYNSYFKQFIHADVWIKAGKIFYIEEYSDSAVSSKTEPDSSLHADQIVDGTGLYMVPGLIDIHMHIESSMMTPDAFCDYLVSCGVTTIVSEPHEMANVSGMKGIMDMVEAGKEAPVDIFYGIPSSVPSTSPELETTGGSIGFQEMAYLKEHPAVICVGEVMNYRQVIKENELAITRYLKHLQDTDRTFPIEGHCPSLTGLDLAKFLYLGINGDHTEHTLEELRQRFANGMFVEIQGKMLRQEVIDYVLAHQLQEHFCFVTDDVMADTLCQEGHLDGLIRQAIQLGMSPEGAIYNATFTAARRMNLLDRGSLAPGKIADFLLLNDLSDFTIQATYKAGICVYQQGQQPLVRQYGQSFDQETRNSIKLQLQSEEILQMKVGKPDGKYLVRVIEVCDGGTRTKEKIVEMEVNAGLLQWQKTGCLLAAVLERYHKHGGIGLGLLCGDCHQQGALATSYAHDSHNLLVVGQNTNDMVKALNRVIELQGGMVVAADGQVKAELQLNIGGILSDQPAPVVGQKLSEVRAAMQELGYQHYNPIMSICTITLPVSPSLKLTDKGLVQVEHSRIVPLVLDSE